MKVLGFRVLGVGGHTNYGALGHGFLYCSSLCMIRKYDCGLMKLLHKDKLHPVGNP